MYFVELESLHRLPQFWPILLVIVALICTKLPWGVWAFRVMPNSCVKASPVFDNTYKILGTTLKKCKSDEKIRSTRYKNTKCSQLDMVLSGLL